MKKYIRLVLGAAILGGICSLWLLGQSNADDPLSKPGYQVYLPLVTANDNVTNTDNITVKYGQISPAQLGSEGVRIDGFTFFIPFEADLLDDMFNQGQSTQNLLNVGIETIISIAVDRNNSIIYYDQWEDGLEPDLTKPTQPSTQVWGDNNLSNGYPPFLGNSPNTAQRDSLQAGDVITLRNIVTLPRAPNNLFFDSGDVLTSIDGAIAVTLTFWTAPPGPGILFTDAWELYPTNRWGTDYRIPVGENLAGTGLNQRLGFTLVCLTVQAAEDNTTVELDLNADGSFERTETLNQGKQFTQLGGVSVGARIRASRPVQVHLFAAYPQAQYEARGYTMVPENQWADDYLAPRSSDGDFWLYNGNGSELEIRIETITRTTSITVPANSTVKYPRVGLSAATGIRFTSTDGRPFYGLAALDAADDQDWGYALLPVSLLDSQTLIGLGLGNNNTPPGPGNGGDGFESRVYVTAVSDATILVDYNNDGNVDAAFPVSALEEVAITDPSDYNMTGAFLFADRTPFAVVWGQDERANPALPSIDAGTGIVPLPSLLLQKTDAPQDRDCTGTVTLNDTINFRLKFFNNSVATIRNIIIVDALPPEVSYVPGTARLNGSTGSSIPDSSSGTAFPFDEGGVNVGDLSSRETGFVTFEVIVSNGNTSSIINRAEARSVDALLGTDTVEIPVQPQPAPPLLELGKTLIDPASGFVTSGQVITFGLTITNTSSATQTEIRLQDTFDGNLLTFLRTNPPPDLTATGVITWNDLTATFGDLLPGASLNITLSFVVNPLPPTIPDTINVASIVEASGNNILLPISCSDSATVRFFEPDPGISIKKYTNGFDANSPGQDPIPKIAPGQVVTWTYVVRNTGNVPLASVTVTDDQGVTPTFVGGDTNNDGLLDLDETWLFRATGVAEDLRQSNRPNLCANKAPIYRNKGIATGDYRSTPVSDEDLSHYCPPATPTPTPTSGCKGKCDGTVTVTPSTRTPPPVGTPAATPTVFPVAFLPETGTKEAFSLKWAFVGGAALLTVGVVVVAASCLGKKQR
jgi:uncharacterized repeat protein (TIGR01451 family)